LTKSMFLLLRFLSHSHINVLIGRIEQCISPVDCGIALRYANNDHHKGALSSVRVHSFVPYRQLGTLVRLTYVASRSVVKRSLNMNNEEKKKRKHRRLVEQIADDMKRIADDTKRIADGTKQNKKRQKVYAVPRGSQFCKSGLGILRKVKDKPTWLSFELMQYLFNFVKTLTHGKHCIQIRKHVINRNAYGEERREVEQATSE
ncbi:hypothetical protein T03_5681, partial [Trichinella britovi]